MAVIVAYIEMKDVGHEYPGGFLAVDGVDISIERGENVAIIGQNGAGKTTTVKMLNGLVRPTRGEILVDGMNTRDFTVAQLSRHVGYVFQNPDDQIFNSTIEAEVAFGTKALNRAHEEIEALIEDALVLTGLQDVRQENPFNLPLSMRKFITIAAILAMDTEVIIFDEPTAGQDLVGNRRLSQILKTLQERGKTLITISHDMEFVVENFSRVIVMANRKVVTSGTPQEVFWDFGALDEAMLKQPYVSRLCRELGVGDRVVTMDEAVEALVGSRRSGLEG